MTYWYSSAQYYTLGQLSSRWQQSCPRVPCINVIFLFLVRPRGMRESPSGRNLPLAVSMTTSQSSTPAAAKTAHPPCEFGMSCVCVAGLICVAFEGRCFIFEALNLDLPDVQPFFFLLFCFDRIRSEMKHCKSETWLLDRLCYMQFIVYDKESSNGYMKWHYEKLKFRSR